MQGGNCLNCGKECDSDFCSEECKYSEAAILAETLLLDGNRPKQVEESLRIEFNLTAPEAQKQLTIARYNLASETAEQPTYEWHIGARLRVYQQAVADRKWTVACKVLEDLAKMQRMYTHLKVTIESAPEIETKEDLQAYIFAICEDIRQNKIPVKLGNAILSPLTALVKSRAFDEMLVGDDDDDGFLTDDEIDSMSREEAIEMYEDL